MRALGVVVAAALVLAACQSATPKPTGAPGAQADLSGSLTTNMGGEPDTIDPQKESFVGEIGVTMKVFEPLMTFDLVTHKPIAAAAKAEPTVSANGTEYTYTLRDGLKFSDGSPLTPADFKYGWERLCDPATRGAYAFTGYIVAGCEAWNTMDPKRTDPAKLAAARDRFLSSIVTSGNSITFKLREPAPYFNSIAGLWVGVPVKKDDVTRGGDHWTEPATFIGNGPFKLTEWKHNEKMVFTRNDHYRTPAKIKTWTQLMINDGAVAFAAYREDELDTYGVTPDTLRTVQQDPDLAKQIHSGPGSCTFYLGFNNSKPPFNDRNARLAFARSFDRQAYATDITHGLSKPATSFIPPGFPGYDPQDTLQSFDAAAAKADLAKVSASARAALAGLKVSYAASPEAKTQLEWFQGQWKANLGVTVALDPVDGTTYTQLVKSEATLPTMFLLGWCADYYDQQDWLTTVFSSKSSTTKIGYHDPKFDQLVFAADREPDPAKRDGLYQQASRLLSQDAPVAFVDYDLTKVLVKPWVHGFRLTGLGFEEGHFTDVYVTKRP